MLKINFLYKIIKHQVNCIYYNFGELVIEVNYKKIKNVVSFLKNNENSLYKLLVDIVILDFPEAFLRFKIIYNICSIKYNLRIKLISCVSEIDPLDSITILYKNSNWMEREIFDMYGIFFRNHPDLRKILSDYGFNGFPLRKDFPLTGYKEIRYDDSQKRIILESLEMTQEFRVFKFHNPWN
jgi:NADH/F420H2 dehydrogenase subunit C